MRKELFDELVESIRESGAIRRRLAQLEAENARLREALEKALRYATHQWDLDVAPPWVEEAIEILEGGDDVYPSGA